MQRKRKTVTKNLTFSQSSTKNSRRDFLKTSVLTGLTGSLAAAAPAMFVNTAYAQKPTRSANEEIGIGAIGMRYQGTVITDKARLYGKVVGIADVDRHVREQARSSFGSTPKIYENYLDLLNQKNVDVICIGAPDHWHTKMLIDACRAGKDVYCEKPLTLTIDEGKLIRNVVQETKQVVQVGTWQRSDSRFRLAVEMIRQGRIGKLKRVVCATNKNPKGGPFKPVPVPAHFNWDLWQGQTPDVPYLAERAHYTFRWWKEYSGGKMTDWGAHHVDIAQWAIDSLPVSIAGRAKYPNIENGYNIATDFEADVTYANGVELHIRDEGRNGILFEGDQGRIFVNRGVISGVPVEELKQKPLNREQFVVYENDNLERPERVGKLEAIVNHMGNFFDCIQSRKETISNIESQHRSVSTCHLANISMEVGRPLKWDPDVEVFVNDSEANGKLSREQRKGFEVI